VKLAKLRWWGKLVSMDQGRLVSRVFRYRRGRIREGTPSWCKSIRELLQGFGDRLNDVWNNEEIGHIHDRGDILRGDLVVIRERRKDMAQWLADLNVLVGAEEERSWKVSMESKKKLKLYRSYKLFFQFENYLSQIPDYWTRRELSRLRSGTHSLRVETGRYKKPKEDFSHRICVVCFNGGVESEAHFLLVCYPYEELRKKMMTTIRLLTGDEYKMDQHYDDKIWMLNLMIGNLIGITNKHRHQKVIRMAVAKFIYSAMKRRQSILAFERE
jgi:hypothetical protein